MVKEKRLTFLEFAFWLWWQNGDATTIDYFVGFELCVDLVIVV